jgi:hypothetical protein
MLGAASFELAQQIACTVAQIWSSTCTVKMSDLWTCNIKRSNNVEALGAVLSLIQKYIT